MPTLNKSMLIGNLGRDPELRYTPNGKAVCVLSLATNLTWKKPDGTEVKHTDWHNIETWGRQAEVCAQYLKTGSLVYAEGRIQYDIVGEGEQRKKYTKIVAQDVQFLDRPNGDGTYQHVPSEENAPVAQEEEIPF